MCILKVGVRTPLVTINILVPKATGPPSAGPACSGKLTRKSQVNYRSGRQTSSRDFMQQSKLPQVRQGAFRTEG